MHRHTAAVQVTIAAQANRILYQGGFAPDDTDLVEMLGLDEDWNRPGLETWIGETIVREGLTIDHTLSVELDRRLAPLIRYVYPERHFCGAA